MERTADQEVAVLRAFGADPWGNSTLIANGSGVSVVTDPDHIAKMAFMTSEIASARLVLASQ